MRKPADFCKPQTLTRIPPYRPGMWVKLRDFAGNGSEGLAGTVQRVKSLTCAITTPQQYRAIWRVCFECGRCCEWHLVERQATEAEIARASR
jgi:hypothetical protein